jgi:phenylalanyl-tRNA synthetase alpha chain
MVLFLCEHTRHTLQKTNLQLGCLHMYQDQFNTLTTVTACLELRDQLMNSNRAAEIKSIIKTATSEEKQALGKELNLLRQTVQQYADLRIQAIQTEQEKDNFLEFDPTFHSENKLEKSGSIHPITSLLEEITTIFKQLGFDIHVGSLVKSQYYNFTAVNTPDYHVARDMQDTFYLKQKDEQGEQYVMRTHVTSNSVEYAHTHKPPFKVIFPGLVFRNETMDATHDINFTQFDMWLVDKDVKVSHLITLSKSFFQALFPDSTIEVRLRPSYFPFTQPSLEGDISCPFCAGSGCRICKNTGWIEVFGAGPIHKNVIEHMKLDPEEWQGMAWGFGVDRLAQLKYGITGVTQFYNGNLKFLNGIR